MSISFSQSQLASLAGAAKQAAQSASSSISSAAVSSGNNSTSVTASSTNTSTAALSSLSSNFNDFLTLLTAQLKNQDPESPMDSSQFTTELVQFTGVQQQVQTNTNLTQLIQLSQDGQLTQSSTLVGKQVVLTGSTVPLQSGQAQLTFDTPLAEPVSISISNAAGQDVKDVQFMSNAGSNRWSWNGTDNEGNALPDGPYNVAIEGADPTGAASPLSFASIGTSSAVQRSSSGDLTVSFGPTTLDYSAVQSVTQ